MLVRNISCSQQALVLLGRDSGCWLWEAGSSFLFWRREVTGEGSWQTDRDKNLLCELRPFWVSSVVAGMGGLGYMLAGAGHKQEFRANTTYSQHLSSVQT